MNKSFALLFIIVLSSLIIFSSCKKEIDAQPQVPHTIAGTYLAQGLQRKATPRVVNDSLIIDSLGPTRFKARFPAFQHRDFEFDVINDSLRNFRLLNPPFLSVPPYADGFVNGECLPLTIPWVHSTYNNRYNRAENTFMLHYTYILGPPSPAYCYSDVNFEKWVKL